MSIFFSFGLVCSFFKFSFFKEKLNIMVAFVEFLHLYFFWFSSLDVFRSGLDIYTEKVKVNQL